VCVILSFVGEKISKKKCPFEEGLINLLIIYKNAIDREP
jgi:hypothetical protein